MKRIVVGISGASGSPLALHFLRALRRIGEVEVHLVVTDSALLTTSYELPELCDQDAQGSASNPFAAYADMMHDPTSLDATISSGSFPIDAMVVIPCSMKTVAGIASGYTDNLLLRVADVTIKEKRPLILVARESPLSPIHLKNLGYLSTLPTISIVPPMLAYYSGQTTIEDMENHVIGKIFSLLGLEHEDFCRWDPES